MAGIRRQLAAEPKNLKLAVAAAQVYLKMGKSSGDPRYFGYAQSTIQPWADDKAPPAPIVKVRAKLLEREHAYGRALGELEALLEREPRDAQALIEIANLHRVRGDYSKAWKACDAISTFGNELQSVVCRVPLMAANGKAEEAYRLLSDLLPKAKTENPELVQWITMIKADIARILGRTKEAESLYQAAMKADADGTYLIRAYSEFLLDQNRPADALPLLKKQINDNGSLLLATIAAHRCGDDALATKWREQLENRYEEIRLRGSEPHGRFESRFALEIEKDPVKALGLALKTWRTQKENRDMRNILEAALAAKRPEPARRVLDFMQNNGTEDVLLRKLADELKAL
jgi:tetratricopeptide (TPR) repeat protein